MDNTNQTSATTPIDQIQSPTQPTNTSTISHLVDITPGALAVDPVPPSVLPVDTAPLPDHKIIDITPVTTSTSTPSPLSDFAPITAEPTPAIQEPQLPPLSPISTPVPVEPQLPPLTPVTPQEPATLPVDTSLTAPVAVVAPAPEAVTNPLMEDPNLVKTIG